MSFAMDRGSDGFSVFFRSVSRCLHKYTCLFWVDLHLLSVFTDRSDLDLVAHPEKLSVFRIDANKRSRKNSLYNTKL